MNSIQEFLAERKAKRIKGKLKPSLSEDEQASIIEAADQEFHLNQWLPNAAKRARQLSIVSHPSKLSHPSSKTSPIIAQVLAAPDGFLRTGNVDSALDIVGNAASLDVFSFLSLQLENGKTILEHMEEGTDLIRKLLAIKTATFEEIQAGFLAIKGQESGVTSSQIKQVYFPAKGDYHLLSLLTPSGLIFELKKRVDTMRFSEETKVAREARRKGDFYDEGFDEIWDLTVIGYGGTKPQNISVLNNKNGGIAPLLLSLPPELKAPSVKLPRSDFFANNLWSGRYRENFLALGRLFQADVNNYNIRQGRDNCYQFIIDRVMDEVWRLRSYEIGWSQSKNYIKLPEYQKVWLDDYWINKRKESNIWSNKVIESLSYWMIASYNKITDKIYPKLGDDALKQLRQLIEKNKEDLL